MELLISKKHIKNPFVIVKARRCGSNSLDRFLNDNIGKENYVNLSGDNSFINYSVLDIVEDDILSGYKLTFCRNPFTRVVAGYLADIYHITPSLGVNISDTNHPIQPPKTIVSSSTLDMELYKLTDNKDLHIEAFTKFLDATIEFIETGQSKHEWQWSFKLVFDPLFSTVLNNEHSNIDFFDDIIKQEELSERWKDVSTKLIGRYEPIVKLNSFNERHKGTGGSTSDFSYLLDYNDNRYKIAKHWQNDFILFGYEI